ncbi:MAG: phosphatidylinositol kinase [Gammaproteobacteria bacterium]|nr:MAG: phosphatidylinositol kinase [Gammaproteobacteria bacterium]
MIGGKCVLTRAATVSKKLDFNAHSIIDILSLVSKSNIGALSIDEVGVKPSFALGLKISELYDAEIAAQLVIDPGANIDLEIAKLIHLWSVGSGAVGGARPKSLVHKKGNGFIAKFNKSTDAFDNARVELACLKMAKAAGINIFGGFVDSGYDQRNILLLERFDLVGNSRSHLVSINSLLKSPENFADYGMMFRYNNVHAVLKKYSNNIEQDVEQLFRQMLFNRAINNTDDHERNFSLINNGEGYQLSPAYDLVPSLTRGEYHAAGYEYSPFPPTPISIDGSRNIFGVRKIKTMEIAEQVIEATRRWMFFAELSGVSEKDADAIEAVLENE